MKTVTNQAALKHLESRIVNLKRVGKPSFWKAENYVGAGQSKYKFRDCKIPDVRREFKKGFSFLNISTDKEIKKSLRVVHYCWRHTRSFEVLLFCIYFYESLPIESQHKYKKYIFSWQEQVDNWAISDSLSSLFAKFLEADPDLLKIFKKWNVHKNPWYRRQSLVGLLYYSRFRKSSFLKWSDVEEMMSARLADPHYFVQKGVGWTLREFYAWYPDSVTNYIRNNIKSISSVAWVASTEKMPLTVKDKLKVLRKKHSGKNK